MIQLQLLMLIIAALEAAPPAAPHLPASSSAPAVPEADPIITDEAWALATRDDQTFDDLNLMQGL